jgi:hypothetical protein
MNYYPASLKRVRARIVPNAAKSGADYRSDAHGVASQLVVPETFQETRKAARGDFKPATRAQVPHSRRSTRGASVSAAFRQTMAGA